MLPFSDDYRYEIEKMKLTEKVVHDISFNHVVEDMFIQLDGSLHKERPLIVAIDGLSGAGKTTFVEKMKNELKNRCRVRAIHIDDHIVENSKRYNTGYEEWYEYYYLQWDIEKIKNDLLKKIHNNFLEITLPYYDKASDVTTLKKITLANPTNKANRIYSPI